MFYQIQQYIYDLRHETYNRDSKDCYMLVSKLSYIGNSTSDRVKTQASLIKSSTEEIVHYDNVNQVLTSEVASVPKKRGRKPKPKNQESNDNKVDVSSSPKKYNLRQRKLIYLTIIIKIKYILFYRIPLFSDACFNTLSRIFGAWSNIDLTIPMGHIIT
ncbi:hypothetical protein BpHYR1_014607 [Brachionus plicatilis]|uniref:Uncharacterized protein n=1 Tax=Brachionus plicatilis TaxID=10195 RepID=A0A3M7P8M1_BRAPC|nr:hypothetical protein BpHYR1_014607 [Brachionus plicatilis]